MSQEQPSPTTAPLPSVDLHGLSQAEFTTLCNLSIAAKSRAYCPYSRFRVGAALLTAAGNYVSAANLENASYPLTVCAERAALCAAITGYSTEGTSTDTPAETEGQGQLDLGQPADEACVGAARGVRFRAVAVAADADSKGVEGGFVSPCGGCRQGLREFCENAMPVFMLDVKGRCMVRTMGELLPMAFDAVAIALGKSS